jgi:hypothetical protein
LVERLVGDESIKIDAGNNRLDADAVVPLPRQQDEARQIAQRIDERNDLRTLRGLTATNWFEAWVD